MKSNDWDKIGSLMEEMISIEKKHLLDLAERIVPGITSDDILQPNDYPELENNPHFRYQEGVVTGLQAATIAIFHLKQS